MAQSKNKAHERARALEGEGRAAEAIDLYRAAGSVDDAARLLVQADRHREAAQMLMQSLGVKPALVGTLELALKRRALKAAVAFARAGETQRAVELFLALEERARAADVLMRAGDLAGAARLGDGPLPAPPASLPRSTPSPDTLAGQSDSPLLAQRLEAAGRGEQAMGVWLRLKRPGEAGRVATSMGRLDEAIRLYTEAHQYLDAAHLQRELGDLSGALESLVRVPRSDPRYRQAAAAVIPLAASQGLAVAKLEAFIGPYVQAGAQSDQELKLFDDLALLLERLGEPAAALEVLRKMVERDPSWHDAARRLQQLSRSLLDAPLEDEPQEPAAAVRPVSEPPPRPPSRPQLPPLQALQPLHPLPPLRPHEVQATTMPETHLPAKGVPRPASGAFRITPTGVAPHLPTNGGSAGPQHGLPPLEPRSPSLSPRKLPGRTAVRRYSQPGGPVVPSQFAPGAIIALRYRLEEQIGQGGMAAVFRATDLELEEEVALKVFALVEASEVAIARFKLELKLSRQLSHPNIVRLYDIGLHEGHRYISMELLQGTSLKDRMAEPFEFADALRVLEQGCSALQAAHDAGVVHRDIKPDNFFFTKARVLKLMDFGIAKFQSVQGLTLSGSIAGTPAYMSPEQVSNFSAVTSQSDLYSMGVVAYELFTGALPFQNQEVVPLLLQHVNEAPRPPRELNPGVPEDLEKLILKLLEKDPARRFRSAIEVEQELARIRKSYGG